MPRCKDCGNEETADYMVNGFCEDCLEYHHSSDESDTPFHHDPALGFFKDWSSENS